MSVRSRTAFAFGVAGAVGATLILSGRFEGSVVLAVLLVWAARIAPPAALADSGPLLAERAVGALRRQAELASAWAMVVAAAAARAGSADLSAIRGVNAVAGAPLAFGAPLAVAGAWLALAAGVVAASSRSHLEVEAAAAPGSVAVAIAPPSLRRLEAVGVAAQVGLLVTLFAGPQIHAATQVVWWGVGLAIVGAVVFLAGRIPPRRAPLVSTLAAAVGFACVLAGGKP